MSSKENKHTAAFLVSLFLTSKRSLNPKYDLNIGEIAVLRYMCDSIDLNNKRRKCFQTKIHQSQIAKYSHCSLRTVSKIIASLLKKRFIKRVRRRAGEGYQICTYTVGMVLLAYARFTYSREVRKSRASERSTQNLHISNSSNFTNSINHSSSFKNQRQKTVAGVDKQSTSFQKTIHKQKREPLSEETKRMIEECMKKLGIQRLRRSQEQK